MKAKRRFTEHTPPFSAVYRMARNHPAVIAGRTIYPSRVRAPSPTINLFKSGEHSRKIGGTVTKGKWKGMPIYTLTLEERATCPATCKRWRDCFGNEMNWSVRWEHGAAFEAELERQVAALCAALKPRCFVVRLHVLGDFYSVEYVQLWARMLARHKQLHVFGYTARSPFDDAIGVALDALSLLHWERFAMRFSGHGLAERGAETIERPDAPAPAGILCPAQGDKTDCCGTCALCWQTKKNIVFKLH